MKTKITKTCVVTRRKVMYSSAKFLLLSSLLACSIFMNACKKGKDNDVKPLNEKTTMHSESETRKAGNGQIFLETVCSHDPDISRRWKITNRTSSAYLVSYSIPEQNGEGGSMTVSPNSDYYFETIGVTDGQTCVLYTNGTEICTLKTSNNRCAPLISPSEKENTDAITKAINAIVSQDYDFTSGLNSSGNSPEDELMIYGNDFLGAKFDSTYSEIKNGTTIKLFYDNFDSNGRWSNQSIESAFNKHLTSNGVSKMVELSHLFDDILETEAPPFLIERIIKQRIVNFESAVELNKKIPLRDRKIILMSTSLMKKITYEVSNSTLGQTVTDFLKKGRVSISKLFGQVVNVIIYTGIYAIVGVIGGAASGGPVGAVVGGIAAGGVGLLASFCANGWVKNCNLYASVYTNKVSYNV